MPPLLILHSLWTRIPAPWLWSWNSCLQLHGRMFVISSRIRWSLLPCSENSIVQPCMGLTGIAELHVCYSASDTAGSLSFANLYSPTRQSTSRMTSNEDALVYSLSHFSWSLPSCRSCYKNPISTNGTHLCAGGTQTLVWIDRPAYYFVCGGHL